VLIAGLGACGGSEDGGGDGGANDDDGGAASIDATAPVDADHGVLTGWCQISSPNFSFFVTSMNALWAISGDPIDDWSGGLGGDFGGLTGADGLCQQIGAATGNGDKTWRAFLSATNNGSPIHAIDRVGSGPWYDANGRMVATGVSGLTQTRPDGDPQSTEDLPDECGVPISVLGDAHDTPTGSDQQGRLFSSNPESTCNDWTSSDPNVGGDGTFQGGLVMAGHTFPRMGFGGLHWLSDHQLRGCGKGANLLQNGAGEGRCIGCTGGYGQIYCFAE
jgi:hypothetical protein